MQLTNPSHMQTYPVLKYFAYDHLPEHLQPTSKAFHDVAEVMANTVTDGDQKKEGLQKLLEAKDCFVRANLK